MYELSGANWRADSMPYSGALISTYLEAAAYEGRTCIGLKSTAGSNTMYGGPYWYPYYTWPAATNSTDPQQFILRTSFRFAFETISLAADETYYILDQEIENGHTTASRWINIRYYIFQVNGGNTQLKARVHDTQDGSTQEIVLVDGAAVDTFYRLDAHIWSDKVSFYLNGALVDTVTYIASLVSAYMLRPFIFFPDRTKADLRVDAFEQTVQEIGFGAVGSVMVNGKAASGDVYFIEEAALETAIAGGDAYIATIADGSFTDPAASDSDYLCIPIESTNAAGGAALLNKNAGGEWDASMLRAVDSVEGYYGAGVGWNIVDDRLPNISPARPGYVYATLSDIQPPPPAPSFDTVERESGIVRVWLSCTEPVDGYDLEWATTDDQDTASRMFSSTGYVEIPANGVIWMWARSVRGTATSAWTQYGELGEDQDEFTTVWSDGDVTGADGASYPSLQELAGIDIKYYLNKIYPYGVGSPSTIAIWTVASGVTLSEFGGKYEFRCTFNSSNTLERIGVIFGADVDIYGGWNAAGQSYYYLSLQYDDVGVSKDFRAKLSTIDAGTESAFIGTSGNLYSMISGDVASVAVIMERQGNTFRVYLNGTLAWSVTDTTIPGSVSRPHTGIYWVPDGAGDYFKIFDYLNVYSRNVAGSPASVDAGKYYDDLLGTLTNGALVVWDGAAGQLTDVSPLAALTGELTTITHTAPGTPDYAVQDLTDTGGFGFATKDEGNSVLAVIANLQSRVNELEARLQTHGLIS